MNDLYVSIVSDNIVFITDYRWFFVNYLFFVLAISFFYYSVFKHKLSTIWTYSAYCLFPLRPLECKLYESRKYSSVVHCLVPRPIMVYSLQSSTEQILW